MVFWAQLDGKRCCEVCLSSCHSVVLVGLTLVLAADRNDIVSANPANAHTRKGSSRHKIQDDVVAMAGDEMNNSEKHEIWPCCDQFGVDLDRKGCFLIVWVWRQHLRCWDGWVMSVHHHHQPL
jgi:hypothetical protein